MESPPPRASWPYADRRKADRRARPTRAWSSLLGFRRRRHGRRHGDRGRAYFDRFERQDVALTLGVFVLNLLDAALTLHHLDRGAEEVNPVMEWLLDASPRVFLLEKIVVVGTALLLLLVHRHFRLAHVGLWLLFLLYAGLFGWHLLLRFASAVS